MIYLKKYGKPLIRFIFKLKAQKTIARLRRESGPYQKMLGNTLKEALENNISLEEKVWIDKIELLRKKLESLTDKIVFTDFGAREIPDPKVYDKENEEGRIVTTIIGEKCKGFSETYFWMLVLFKLIRKFKPSSCLELGTGMGISTSFLASSLFLNGNGKIVTMEGAESLVLIAKKNFQTLNLNNIDVVLGRFQDTLPKVLNENSPIDYAFFDGHLDGIAIVNYFNQIIPFCRNKAVLIIDGISWSPSMKKAWEIIEADERVKITCNLRHLGICIIDNERLEKQSYRIPLF
jgi:predicted O-methyltransferase YrrM